MAIVGDIVYPATSISIPGGINANIFDSIGTQILLGQKVMASSLPITIASDQSAITITAVALTNGNQKTQIVDGSNLTVGPVQTISSTNYMPVVLAASATPASALVARSIQIAGSDGTNAQTLSVDSTGKINVNNISGTVSLPTGASTAAKQPALGTAGTASTDVITIQGIASMTAIAISAASLPLPSGAATETSLAKLTQTQGSTTSGQSGTLMQGAVTTAAPSYTTAQTSPLSLTTAGALRVDPSAVTAPVNISQYGGSATTLGQKVSASSIPVVIASDQSSITMKSSGNVALQFIRNDYTATNVTTAAYTQLIASTSGITNVIEIFDSSGQTLKLATGAAASEIDQFLIFPGGNGRITCNIAAGTRISIKAVSATASVGEIDINLYT